MEAAGRSFGRPIRRVEDPRFLKGAGRYTDDVTLHGQTHMVFVRSPHAHAEIVSIDTSRAAAAPGVVRVLTGEDYAAAGLGMLFCGWPAKSRSGEPQKAGGYPPLARGRVRFVGNIVAAVIAETRAQAEDAAALVAVDYRPLPAVTDVLEALREGAPQLHDDAPGNLVVDWELGDAAATEAAFARAAHVTRIELRNNRLVPNAMEPRATNAVHDPGSGEFTMWISTQNPHGLKTFTAVLTGIAPEHKLRFIAGDVGGGFGSKAFVYAEDAITLFAARETGRPVKWTATRSEAFLADAHGRDHHTIAELALDRNGRFLAVRAHTRANMGAYLSTSATLVPTFMSATLLTGQYHIPAAHARVDCVFTNTAPVDAYRGAGRPEAAYVIERLVDLAARQTGRDPAELRRINMVDRFPYTNPAGLTYDSCDFRAVLDKALAAADYAGFLARRAEAARRGRLRGIGMATYIEACGFGPSRVIGQWGGPAGAWESSEIRVLPTGQVEVHTGCMNHGQGHETVFAQYVADAFGVPMESVRLIYGDSGRGQHGNGTVGSRSGPVGIGALARSTARIIAKARRIARHTLGADSDEEISFENGVFRRTGTNQALTFAEVAWLAHGGQSFPTDEVEPGLHAAANFDPPNFTFPAGAHVCEVEIDPETGRTGIVRFVACDDFGNLGNPMIVEGQVHGGVVQGIGQALMEHAVYDPDGQLLSASFMDYAMPRADAVPPVEVLFHATPATANPMGMKGCGEAGAIGAPPAVINAVVNALDIDHLDMPATPERVWRALMARRAAAPAD
ncbi:MAG: xanthine dehydrogenase family protein molybdopterin-binding subunit [Alphaproteobacteria bacterium]|nr:MAG: xanthine dehydrogenase family protein molybdopterin-binding subunit [Alphaproteobacteria bacterium]